MVVIYGSFFRDVLRKEGGGRERGRRKGRKEGKKEGGKEGKGREKEGREEGKELFSVFLYGFFI